MCFVMFQALGLNRDGMRETTTTKTLYSANSPVIRNTGNMSELDSLLQDLSSTSKMSQNSNVSRGKSQLPENILI